MSYTSQRARVDASSAWEKQFDDAQLRELHQESKAILNMAYGAARRERLLELLKKGYRICLNFSYGGSWNSKDKDIQRLLKQKKVKAHKQYTLSAVTPHMNHTYLGIA